MKAYYMWRNAGRERKWSAMSEREKGEYLATTKDTGNKRYVSEIVVEGMGGRSEEAWE